MEWNMINKDEAKSLLKDRPYWREGDCIFFILPEARMIDFSLVTRISYSLAYQDDYYDEGDTISITLHTDSGYEDSDENITVEYPWSENFIAQMRDLFKDFAEIRGQVNKNRPREKQNED
jgi:hypothetical protein